MKKVPAEYHYERDEGGATVRQIRIPQSELQSVQEIPETGTNKKFVGSTTDGRSILVGSSFSRGDDKSKHWLKVQKNAPISDWLEGTWINPRPSDTPIGTRSKRAKAWSLGFRLKSEKSDPETGGLRDPQIGAYHAAKAHWTTSEAPATIVMPTGTGKTETMLALFASENCEGLTVIVPSDALREQVGRKFLEFGLLRELGIVDPNDPLPVVAFLEKRPHSIHDVDAIYAQADVVITTMQLLSGCSNEVRNAIAGNSSHAFIDEAHHVPAPKWNAVRSNFSNSRVIQFTATPFREDGKSVDGKTIYSFPIKMAQEQGYFAPISFVPIDEVDLIDADLAIAKKAIEVLTTQHAAGRPQVVMARCATVKRALTVFDIYAGLAADWSPILMYNGLGVRAKKSAHAKLMSGEAKIVVCVDMLGEGFDLPTLKIAAIHDQRRGLAITLQFAGRFTRTQHGNDLGAATAIANISDQNIGEAIRELYAEDADWNAILPALGEKATKQEARKAQLIDGFSEMPDSVSPQNITPKLSAVVFKTTIANWTPENLGISLAKRGGVELFDGPHCNDTEAIAYAITKETETLGWVDAKGVKNVAWHIYLVHWDQVRGLLYINSSNNSSMHQDVAEAICGDEAILVKGEEVYRALDGLNRIVLSTLGLSEKVKRRIKHIQSVGEDITEDLPTADRLNKTKTNLVAHGYLEGERMALGASHKGRVWELREASDMAEWMAWCGQIGPKLVDESLSTADIIKRVILPERAVDRPPQIPILVEWPLAVSTEAETALRVKIGTFECSLSEAELKIADHNDTGPLRIRVVLPEAEAIYRIRFSEQGVSYHLEGNEQAILLRARSERNFDDWFASNPPIIRFAKGGHLEGDLLCLLPEMSETAPYDAARIVAWEWADTNIRRESQTVQKLDDSIQLRTIAEAMSDTEVHFDVIMDDDSSGEASDIVCIGMSGDKVLVRFYHCKFSTGDNPGARVGDLYEVCGQTQKSVRWVRRMDDLIRHLRARDSRRERLTTVGRFERGDIETLKEYRKRAGRREVVMEAVIVQPGLSKAKASVDQLALLSSTESYLSDVGAMKLTVVGSK